MLVNFNTLRPEPYTRTYLAHQLEPGMLKSSRSLGYYERGLRRCNSEALQLTRRLHRFRMQPNMRSALMTRLGQYGVTLHALGIVFWRRATVHFEARSD